MAIDESFFVNVEITRIDRAAGVAGFGIVNIIGTSDVIGQQERIRFYGSEEAVLNDFGSSAEEFKAAESFFAQNPRPQELAISRRLLADVPGFAIGLKITSLLAAFQAVSDAEFSITIDGVQHDITPLDFTTAIDFEDIAIFIQVGLNNEAEAGFSSAVVTFDTLTEKFKIVSGTTGDLSTVSFLSPVSGGLGTDVSDAAFLNMQSGVQVSGVTAGATIVDEIGKIIAVNDTWYWLVMTNETRDNADVEAIATFIEGLKKIYVTTTNNDDSLDPISTTDTMYKLKNSDLARTAAIYHDIATLYPDVSIAARMGSVDFLGADTTITGAFKQLPGISPVDLNQNELDAILAKNGSTYITSGNLNVFFGSNVANGEFIDTIHGTDWLESYMRNNIFNLFATTATKIPFNDTGIQQVGEQVELSLAQADSNGLLSSELSDDNKNIPAFTVTLPLSVDIPASEKAARVLNGITFKGNYAGAIHFANVTGVLSIQL